MQKYAQTHRASSVLENNSLDLSRYSNGRLKNEGRKTLAQSANSWPADTLKAAPNEKPLAEWQAECAHRAAASD